MFHKSPQKYQMALPVVTNSLSYYPEDAILKIDSLKILLQFVDSSYLTDILYSNDYLIDSHTLLVQNITGLLQDHYISPVDLNFISPDPSSFKTLPL